MSLNKSNSPPLKYYIELFLTSFLSDYLSKNTIIAYADCFRLLLIFLWETKQLNPQKFDFEVFNRELILEFLSWLSSERKCCNATINQRLYALHAFCKFVQYKRPDYLNSLGGIMTIPKRKCNQKIPRYLSEDQIKILLECPDNMTKMGRRDRALLCTLYEGALRVSELVGLNIGDIKFGTYAALDVIGKGNKPRRVFISVQLTKILKSYLNELNYESHKIEESLFKNQWGQRISRFGVDYILKKYFNAAKCAGTGFPDSISPHVLRHSRAMALKAHDVDLMDIRDVLGHSSTEVTETYARIDGKTRNEAIKKCSSILVSLESPCWEKDKDLKEFLKSLSLY